MSYVEYLDHLRARLLEFAPRPEGANRLDPESIVLGRPPSPDLGDLALPAFPLAKAWKGAPPALAARWAAGIRTAIEDGSLRDLPIPLTRVDAAGPYVNLTFDRTAFACVVLRDITTRGGDYGHAADATGETVMVEYSSPNTNKPLHLGHVRNNLLGMTISNLLEAVGHRVVRVNLVNDRGIHICKSMLAYQRFGNGETPADTGEKGDHFVGRYYVLFDRELKAERRIYAEARGVDLDRYTKEALRSLPDKEAVRRMETEGEQFDEEFERQSEWMGGARTLLLAWEAGDADVMALWRRMNEWVYAGFRESYTRLGCRFDRWYFESEVWQLGKDQVERGLELGVFYREPDGSVWARLEPLGLQNRVVIRSDGTTVYITQDLGTAVKKFEDYGLDRSIYVVGHEQEVHFKNLFGMLKLLGYPWAERCYHASYGLVTLPKGMGKLKSREGTAVDADELLDELHALARQKIEEGGYCDTPESIAKTAEAVGQGAIKLYLLQVGTEKSVEYDPSSTISFTGDTGPAVQYSHARICGILRKGLAGGMLSETELVPAIRSEEAWRPVHGPFLRHADAALLIEREERDVLRLVSDLPFVIANGARQLSGAPIASYLLELTKAYARMYHEHEVLRAESAPLLRARIQLGLAVAQTLRNGLALLGIAAPEQM